MAVKLSPTQRTWVIGTSSSNGQISLSSTPKQHEDIDSAMREADRLASSAAVGRTGMGPVTSQKYIVLEVVAIAEVSAVRKKGF